MAIKSNILSGAVVCGTRTKVVSGSVSGVWYLGVNSDARTAQGTTKLCSPLTITDATFGWLKIDPDCGATRCIVRARVPIATTAVGTSPLVALIGLWRTDLNSTVEPAAATGAEFQFERLDTPTINATGSALTFPASPAATTTRQDAVWYYSLAMGGAGFTTTDILGAHYLGVVVTVAGACTASAAMPIDVMLLN